MAGIGAETTRSPEALNALNALMRTMMKSTQSLIMQSWKPQGRRGHVMPDQHLPGL